MMFDTGVPGFGISIAFVVTLAIVAGVLLFLLVTYLLRLQRRGAVSGRGSIVGGTGMAMQDFTGAGRVWLEGEAWQAVSDAPVVKGQSVLVRNMDGLTLIVEPLAESGPTHLKMQT
jgi:membrane-bound serine protease (ClpP class)